VPHRDLRPVMLVGVLSLLVLLGGPPAAASAEVEASRITAPADPAYTLFDRAPLPHQPDLTVSGTTVGSGSISLRCYYGKGANEYLRVAEKVTPTGNSFSLSVETGSLYGGPSYEGPCVLRAVPYEDPKAQPPGSPEEEAADPFQGPHIANSRFEVFAEEGIAEDYELESNSLSSQFEIESVGDCGLFRSNLFAPSSLAKSTRLFECDAALYEEDEPPFGKATRSELQVDGTDAYGPATAAYLERRLGVNIPAAPQISVTQAFDATTGLDTIHEVDPIVRCTPGVSFPPTATSCTSFVSTGVQLERVWQTSAEGRAASMTDSWSSTDGQAHTLDALYHQELVDAGKSGGSYELPGSAAFAAATRGELAPLPSGPGAIYYKVDAETPAGGDGEHPQGAIVYDPAPSGPLSVFEGGGEGSYEGFEMPYQGTIPATGSYTLRMAFIQAYALAEVQPLVAATILSYPPTPVAGSPSIETTPPTPGITVSPTPSSPHAAQVGSASGSGGRVRLTLACSGTPGTSCEVQATLATVERTRGSRPVAVAARHRHPRTRPRHVPVGSSSSRIPAGRRITITIALNSAGRRLLARFGRLPVHLRVGLVSPGQHTTIVAAENLTVKPAHRRRGRRRRHRP
jgi:hypothetical protein